MSDVFISYKTEDRRRIEPLVRALEADGNSVWWDQHIGAGEAVLAARSGNRELAMARLADLKGRDGEFVNVIHARVYAQLGDIDRAFEALNRAWEVRDSGLRDLKIDP